MYLYAAVEPVSGASVALLLPYVKIESFNVFQSPSIGDVIHITIIVDSTAGRAPAAERRLAVQAVSIIWRSSIPPALNLADELRRLMNAGVPLECAADHGVSEDLYLRDPDSNGVELYRDRPSDQWMRSPNGSLNMFAHALDFDGLLASAPSI